MCYNGLLINIAAILINVFKVVKVKKEEYSLISVDKVERVCYKGVEMLPKWW
jgi:hypothetical protein